MTQLAFAAVCFVPLVQGSLYRAPGTPPPINFDAVIGGHKLASPDPEFALPRATAPRTGVIVLEFTFEQRRPYLDAEARYLMWRDAGVVSHCRVTRGGAAIGEFTGQQPGSAGLPVTAGVAWRAAVLELQTESN